MIDPVHSQIAAWEDEGQRQWEEQQMTGPDVIWLAFHKANCPEHIVWGASNSRCRTCGSSSRRYLIATPEREAATEITLAAKEALEMMKVGFSRVAWARLEATLAKARGE